RAQGLSLRTRRTGNLPLHAARQRKGTGAAARRLSRARVGAAAAFASERADVGMRARGPLSIRGRGALAARGPHHPLCRLARSAGMSASASAMGLVHFVSVGLFAGTGGGGVIGLAAKTGFSLPLLSTERHSAGN